MSSKKQEGTVGGASVKGDRPSLLTASGLTMTSVRSSWFPSSDSVNLSANPVILSSRPHTFTELPMKNSEMSLGTTVFRRKIRWFLRSI